MSLSGETKIRKINASVESEELFAHKYCLLVIPWRYHHPLCWHKNSADDDKKTKNYAEKSRCQNLSSFASNPKSTILLSACHCLWWPLTSKGSRPLIGPARLPLLTAVVMLPATIATMKSTLTLYAGQVYWFAPGFSAKQLACQLQPISGLFLLDVYVGDGLVTGCKSTLGTCE